MKVKFLKCMTCGNVMVKVSGGAITPTCCGNTMVELVPNTSEGKIEYHIPVMVEKCESDEKKCGKEKKRICIKIGQEHHPMTAEHHIEFIYIDTDQGGFIHYFKVGDLPELCIDDCRCSIKAIYAYCNLHGLWKCDCVLKCSNAK